MRVRLSARGRYDLDRIYAYLYAAKGERAADQFLESARRATEFIAQNPHAGPHPAWATRQETLRSWVIRGTRFLIFYIPEENEVSIERVLDGRRDVIRILVRDEVDLLINLDSSC